MLMLQTAQITDLPFIVAVYNQTISSHMVTADLQPVTVEERVPWFHEHNPQHYPMWLIMRGETPVGWVTLSQYNSRAAYDHTVEISIYIDEQFRHQRIGTDVMPLIERAAQKIGIQVIISRVFGHNPGSRRLFEKVGYKLWGHLPQIAVMPERLADLEVYGKHLGSD